MKKFTIFTILMAILTLFACAEFKPAPANPVCPHPNSWICEKSEQLGIEPETVYGWIYSAVAVAAVTDIVSIAEVCDFEAEVADYYTRAYPLSYDTLINEVFRLADMKQPEKALLIKNILNRQLIQYANGALITPVDDMILRRGHVAFRSDMLCFGGPR